MAHSLVHEVAQGSYVGRTWSMNRWYNLWRHIKSLGRVAKRMAKVGNRTMSGIWCRRMGLWYTNLKNTQEYHEVLVRPSLVWEKVAKRLAIRQNKARHILFSTTLESIPEEKDTFLHLFGKTD